MVRKLRTAVLVVHGMGSQRPLETVRGVINAVWFDNDDHAQDPKKKLWSHPEPSGVDIDLTVMTTNEIPGSSDDRVADFHELYWAHHMSETKAVAVLLWLFELGRRGPYFKTGMNGLWWCGAVYLCLLLLSVAVVALRGVVWLSEIVDEPEGIVATLFIMLCVAFIVTIAASLRVRWTRLLKRLALGFFLWMLIGLVAVGAVVLFKWGYNRFAYSNTALIFRESAAALTCVFLPIGAAYLAATMLMGQWGARAFGWALVLSFGFYAIYLVLAYLGCFGSEETISLMLREGRVPWSMCSEWSAVAAWVIIGAYLLMNAAFLQPFLGDAARYFRNSPANVAVRRTIRKDAVDTIEQLHRSREYDRIVVVAHSLGTVVAYDMLRAYYSRICSQIAVDKTKLNPEFDTIDSGKLDCASMRDQGRELIRKMARHSKLLADAAREEPFSWADSESVDAWLVTDFVSLGSPLTHARYLMVNEDDGEKAEENFLNRVRERELSMCPPARQNNDGLISFTNEGKVRLHHGGMFGTTRWTNLYFPVSDIFWGDAIGGPIRKVFGECVDDVPVWSNNTKTTDGFKHVAYWKTDFLDGRKAQHIQELIMAINLEDKP